jgi:hypothetical protein
MREGDWMPMPPGGLLPWLSRTGYYKRTLAELERAAQRQGRRKLMAAADRRFWASLAMPAAASVHSTPLPTPTPSVPDAEGRGSATPLGGSTTPLPTPPPSVPDAEGRGSTTPLRESAPQSGDLSRGPKAGASCEGDVSRGSTTPLCWIWRGSVDRCGTPRVRVNGREYTAAQWAWLRIAQRKIPRGYTVRATRCGDKCCVNPDHCTLVRKGGFRRSRHLV